MIGCDVVLARAILSHQQVFDPDGQITHSNAGRVVYGVSDGSGSADISEFAQSLDSRWVDVSVDLRNKNNLDLTNVGIHRNAIISEVVIDIPRQRDCLFR